MLKELVRERLIAAAEEIYVLFQTTMASYGEQLCRAREENARQRRQLEAAQAALRIQGLIVASFTFFDSRDDFLH